MSCAILVIPCYNEESRLDDAAFRNFLKQDHSPFQIHFLFVNDGSTDRTLEHLRALASEFPDRIKIMNRTRNQGKAEAVRSGILEALSLTPKADWVGYWDADLATPLREIARFLTMAEADHEKHDLFFGSRIRLCGNEIDRTPLRHYMGRIFATLASSWVLRLPIYDTQCGAKIFRVCDDLPALFQEPFRTGWTFDVELLARLLIRESYHGHTPGGKAVLEIPLLRWTHQAGSKVVWYHFFTALYELAIIRFQVMKS